MDDLNSQLVDQALGLLPMGSYLMTASHDGVRSGMLVCSAFRCCDEPNLICVSARKGHKIDPLIRDSRSFAIGIIDPDDKLIRRRFRSTDSVPTEFTLVGDDDPFDALPTQILQTGSPILTRCATWFDCEVMRRVDLEAETELFVGLIISIWHRGQEIKLTRKPELGESD